MTDRSGAYTLSELADGTFRVRASAAGYDPGEQNITVPDIPRADFLLRRSSSTESCAYSVAPSGSVGVPFTAGQFTLAVTRTSGACGWQAVSDVNWITLSTRSGRATAAITVSYGYNTAFVGRFGTVSIPTPIHRSSFDHRRLR